MLRLLTLGIRGLLLRILSASGLRIIATMPGGTRRRRRRRGHHRVLVLGRRDLRGLLPGVPRAGSRGGHGDCRNPPEPCDALQARTASRRLSSPTHGHQREVPAPTLNPKVAGSIPARPTRKAALRRGFLVSGPTPTAGARTQVVRAQERGRALTAQRPHRCSTRSSRRRTRRRLSRLSRPRSRGSSGSRTVSREDFRTAWATASLLDRRKSSTIPLAVSRGRGTSQGPVLVRRR
jgi:hypothetical protein